MKRIGIVGGGIAGLLAAWFAQKRGHQVTLFDKARAGSGCSSKAGGMLVSINELEFRELDLLQASLKSREMYRALAPAWGNVGLNVNGTLEVGIHPDDIPWLRRYFDYQQSLSLPVSWLNGNEAREVEPFLSTRVSCAISSPEDIQIDQIKVLEALRVSVFQNGGTLEEGKEIVHWNRENEKIEVIDKEGIVYSGFDQLWIATGTGILSKKPAPFEVFPVRGEMISLALPDYPFLQKTIRIRNKILGHAYLVPKEDRILLGSTSEEKGFAQWNTAGGIMDILRKTYAAVPGVYELPIIETWAGLRPATLARKPMITQEENLPVFYLNGLFRHGILLAPILALGLVQFALQEKLQEEVIPFIHT